MPKAGKKNHILGDFFSKATKKNAKTGKEFGIEGKKEHFRHRPIPYHNSFPYFCCIIAYIWKNEVQRQLLEKEPKSNS